MPEFFSRNGRRVISSRKDFQRRNDLPYGKWVCEDGRVVLFNRFYEPLYQRRPGEPMTDADPAERVPFIDQQWFYGDGDSEQQKRRKAEIALNAFLAEKSAAPFDTVTASKKAG